MKEVLNILEMLQNTTARTKKERILRENFDNQQLKCLFEYVYNPYKIYGIGAKSLEWGSGLSVIHQKTIFDLLDYLLEHNTGTDFDKSVVSEFLARNEDCADWYKRIILKDLRVGVTAKTINKIWAGLIPVFDLMLAKSYWSYADRNIGRFIVTKKLDGIRCALIINEDGSIELKSRQGQLFYGLNEIVEEAKQLPKGFVFDGELLLRNDNNLSSKDLYRATMKEVSKDGDKHNVEFHCFDMLPLNAFQAGGSQVPCETRKNMALQLIESINSEFIVNVPILYVGEDKEKIVELLNKAIANGEEGVIVNIASRGYECKRTDAILKVKKMSTVDLKIVGFERGSGKFAQTLGATIVDYKGHQVKVGSGYSDVDRFAIWSNQESLIDTIMEVQFFEETQNQNGGISLRFPVFVRLRPDKTEPSYD